MSDDGREPADDARLEAMRRRMVREQIAGRVRDPRVWAAMEAVPRHLFVPKHLRYAAHADSPLPIGDGQTISQPLMVATMIEALQLASHDRVLDVGGGSGYQAAVLAQIAREVISIEIQPRLADRARESLARAGIDNVRVVVGDGGLGYPAGAPYDGIVVAAAAPRVPRALVDQLAVGGRLVLPIGPPHGMQRLVRVRRDASGVRPAEELTLCAFVPLVGQQGWR
ncbi:MAG TPA: protein-L-isoaspartate(D-aspartate) O-methyltransferase [Sandaracinaceae bacterium LLY-WYZ-13_1]|nr:protein-L-isoaspartate(D-aspartate) O-methyltransferase [Sandaracinaceae bacterium LLY-WYZ-13_1]